MRKIGLLCLALVLALGTLGIGYATWSANVTIEQEVYSGELCTEFDTLCTVTDELGDGYDWTIEWLLCDPGHTKVKWLDKDEAWCTCNATDKDGDGSRETMVITCNNTYPSYYNHLDFWLCNCGTIPSKIQGASVLVDGVVEYYWDLSSIDPGPAPCVSLDLTDDDKDDIELHWGNCFGRQLHPGYCDANCSFDWHILQDAPQNAILGFEIEIHTVQWNKYVDPTD
jgi:hypothetical protein